MQIVNPPSTLQCTCPRCGSENTQKFAMVYANGAAMMHGTGVGVGLGVKSGLGVGGGGFNAASSSVLAQMCAPPTPMKVVMPTIGIFIATMLVGAFAMHWKAAAIDEAAAVVAGLYFLIALRHNLVVHPRALEEWGNRFLCMRCQAVFEPKSLTVAAP